MFIPIRENYIACHPRPFVPQCAMTFICEITPRFSQLDPAGILFFGEVFPICAGVYEDFLQSLGFGWDEWFRHPETASPVRQANAEYFHPLRGGQVYSVAVEVVSLSTSAFALEYSLRQQDALHCRVRIVHVFISKTSGAKIPVPGKVREALTQAGIRAELGFDSEAPSAAASPAASGAAPAGGDSAAHAQTAAPGH